MTSLDERQNSERCERDEQGGEDEVDLVESNVSPFQVVQKPKETEKEDVNQKDGINPERLALDGGGKKESNRSGTGDLGAHLVR